MLKYALLKCICVTLYIFVIWTMMNKLQILHEHHRHRPNIQRRHLTPGWDYSTQFPVDVVYTWVNGSDPKVLEDLERFKNMQRNNPLYVTGRFAENGELHFSLRSLEKNANWIRHVFIVTNGQVPQWLDLSNPRVTIVKHEDIFHEPESLPTFSSCAIEHNIHKIKGLSEKFLYLNDDFLFGRKVSLDDFYTDDKVTKVYLAWHSDTMCDTECHAKQIKNGICEEACNYIHCAWDGGDCDSVPMEMRPKDSDKEYSKYKTSILYTDAIYNRAFGYKHRRVVAHVPLFMEKTIKKEMDKRFSKEVCETTRHKLRGPLELQFQFSYVHFLMEEYRHLRRFDVKVFSPDVTFMSVTNNFTKTYSDLDMIWETKRKGSPKFVRQVTGYNLCYLHFSNSKFICINNDIDYTHNKNVEKVEDVLGEFYKMMFPNPSLFEKPNWLPRFR